MAGWRTDAPLAGNGVSAKNRVSSAAPPLLQRRRRPFLRELGRELTPELIDREKWNAFWDSPLSMRSPGGGVGPGAGRNPAPSRDPAEVRRALGAYSATGCKVKTDGSRLEVSFPGLTLGIFSGRLQFTVYKPEKRNST